MMRTAFSILFCCLGMLLSSQYHKLTSVIDPSVADQFLGMYPFSTCDGVSNSQDHIPEQDSFSACLLVMDDNHRLVEWIAYHYYALNLRYLIIADDPSSTEDPSLVLDRWKDKIKIEVWSDTTYLGPTELSRFEKQDDSNATEKDIKYRDTFNHRLRQPKFYRRCAARLKEQNRTWTGFYDNDEYLALNTQIMNNTDKLVAKPNHLYDMLKELHQAAAGLDDSTLLGYHFSKPCILLPRINYGHTESSDEDIQKDVPRYLDPSRFDTLRWTHRSSSEKKVILGKAIVDVSQLPAFSLKLGAFGNAHRPFKMCKTSNAFVNYNIPLGLHHYSGSWEQYNYRKNDARYGLPGVRDYGNWLGRGGKDHGVWDETRPWIQGFSRLFGDDTETVARMLDGAGLASNRSVAFTKRKYLG